MSLGVRSVSVTYGSVSALEGVTLDLGVGCTALLGANGAGKSTLLGVLAGIRRPSSGELVLDGDVIKNGNGRRRLHRQLGYLPQDAQVPMHLTVLEAMEYAAWLKKLSASSARANVTRALEAVDLHSHVNDKVKTLSGGMQRRLAIAQSVVSSPTLLLLDEPTTGLDVGQRAGFRDIIRQISGTTAVLVSTHVVGDIAPIADRLVVIDHGRVRFDGAVADIGQGTAPATAQDLESVYLAHVDPQ